MSTTLVRNGTIVTASDRYDADIYIDHGTIALIGQGLSVPADTVVDASGLLVLPGGIDAHTHLDMPAGDIVTTDDFENGTKAAAFGGTTTIIDFATPEPGADLGPTLDRWLNKARDRAVIDYGFHMVIREASERALRDMEPMVRRHGVTSFKVFMAYPGTLMMDDGDMLRVMRRAADLGGLVLVHAENGRVIEALVKDALSRGDTAPRFHAETRPSALEGEATNRAIVAAGIAGARVYIVHLTCRDALEAVERARSRRLPVFAETCPQYLCLTRDEYERAGFEGAKFVMSPPLRTTDDQEALWDGLRAGSLQTVATDHCPWGMDDPPHKQRGRDDFSKIPGGAPGIETRLMLLWDAGVRSGRIDEHRFVAVTAANPARLFGLWPRKGTIAVDSDGDLVLWDPARHTTLSAATLHMRIDYSPYEGRRVIGGPAVVLSRGEVVVDHGTFIGRPGRGQFLKREGSGPC